MRQIIDAMKEKLTEAEIIRRLTAVTEDEDKYFPGVLGSPVTFAARLGLPLSKGYRQFKANKMVVQNHQAENSGNGKVTLGRRKSLSKLPFIEIGIPLSTQIQTEGKVTATTHKKPGKQVKTIA